MTFCEFGEQCEGLNFSGFTYPKLCPFHQAINVSLTKDEKINLFHSQRRNRLLENGNHPIFIFLRNLKKQNQKAFEKILFYFGEMSVVEQQDPCICWAPDETYLNICKEAFQILCPNIKFITKDTFRLEWKKDEMDPIVFDKLIFPDFLFIDKNTLHF